MTTTNLIAVTFDDSSKAYQVLSDLKQAGQAGKVTVRSAAVVERDHFGSLTVPEGTDTVGGDATLSASLVGMLVGILGGPVGMLVGWGTGALVGSLVDIDRAGTAEALLAEYSRAVPPGSNAVVAEIDEASPDVIDGMMRERGGTVTRRAAADVLVAMEAAEEAAKAAEHEARKAMRAEKKEARKENYDERKAALRAKLHRD